jgi:cytochrome oxidase Cu insertion factor (SCO1/SenC/PrrC family)
VRLRCIPDRIACALGAVLIGMNCGIAASAQEFPQRPAGELMDVLMWNREPVGGPFTLVDHTGRIRTNAEFRGKILLVYFGFTSCPDICPTDLQQIALALDALGPASGSVQPLFITVDPERDTPEHLAEYVPLFHPRLMGFTGTPAQIRAAADAYRAYYKKVTRGDGSDYAVDHSAFLYVMDREGRFVGFLPPGSASERIIEAVTPLLSAGPGERQR